MNLGNEIKALIDASADMLHLDIMDNHYVPNLTFGPGLCAAIHKKFPNLKLDVHLMTIPTDDLIEKFAKNGAYRISIHPNATLHLDRSIQLIKSFNCKAGVTLNPSASVDEIKWCANHLDFVMLMTVNPGFGGQTLIKDIIPKITEIKSLYKDIKICVDGGVGIDNINTLASAGAQDFVVGSSIFNNKDYAKSIASLRNQLQVNI